MTSMAQVLSLIALLALGTLVTPSGPAQAAVPTCGVTGNLLRWSILLSVPKPDEGSWREGGHPLSGKRAVLDRRLCLRLVGHGPRSVRPLGLCSNRADA